MSAAFKPGWEQVPLEEIALLRTGPFGSALHKSDYVEGGIPLINPTHIRDGALAPSRSVSVTAETATRLQDYKLNAGDIVMGRRGEMGRCALVPPEAAGWLCGTGSVVIRGAAAVDPAYLQRFFSAPETVAKLSGDSVGSTMVNLNQRVLLGLEVPLPPFAEQKRIADKLDSVLARVDACRDRLDRIPALLKRFRQSVLAAATSGGLTEDWRTQQAESLEAWRDTTIGELATVVRGASPRPAGDPKYFGGECPWITVGELTKDEGKFLTRTSAFVTEEGKKRSRYIEVGTLLLTNSGATLGVPKITQIGGCINDGSVALLALNEPTKSFLYWLLKGLTDHLRGLNQGAAQPNLNTGIVKAIAVNLPGQLEQHEIVRRVETLFAFADRLEARCAAARKQAGQLTPALLAKAFRGELVPQDPADEPAAELLKRLAARRAEAPKARRGRKPVAAGE